MITSIHNEKIHQARQLLTAKGRRKQKAFLAEGRHLVYEAVKAQLAWEIFCLEGAALPDSFTGAVTVVNETVLKSLAETKSPQDMIARCAFPSFSLDFAKARRLIVLDGVQDPGNIGTILRTALAFGVDGALFLKGTGDPFSGKVVRASQGAVFFEPTASFSPEELLSLLRKHDFQIYASSLRDAKEMEEVLLRERMALVLGNEGQGVSEFWLDQADEKVYIPIQQAESLNVAVAAGILMYWFR